jgi:hypothetical protein
MSDVPFMFFGVLFNPKSNLIRVLRIRVNAQLRGELSEKFSEMAAGFEDHDVRDYSSSFFKVHNNELIRRPRFTMPGEYTAAFNDIQSVPSLQLPPPPDFELKALVAHRSGETLFQGYTAQRELSRNRWALVLSGDTFSRFESAGLMVGSTLAAIVRGTDLLINTFSQVRDVLKLTDMYRQASDTDVRTFLGHPLFVPLDQASTEIVVKTVGTTARKRISTILTDGVLGAVTVQQLKDYAAQHPSTTLTVTTVGGKEMIEVPTSAAGVSKLAQLLTGSYFKHGLNGESCVANSFHPVPASATVSLPSSVKDQPPATAPTTESKPAAKRAPKPKKPKSPATSPKAD